MTARIVHVASGREWRGGQRQVWLLARELARRGIGPQTVVTGGGTELARRLTADGVPVRAVRWSAGLDPRALAGTLRELAGGPALLHAHDAHALTITGLAARWRGVPFVVTRRAVFPLRRHGFWTRACRVIAISGPVRDALVADGLDPRRIAVVPSGIDLAEARTTPPADLRRRLRLPPEARVAVSVAALTPEKDPATLLDAAAVARPLLPHLHWVVVGDGPLRGELARRSAAAGLSDRVHLIGSAADAAGIIAAGNVFVLTSTSEGLGSAAIVALAQGVPVVGSRVGGLAELLEGGAGELVPPGDAESFARAVAGVLLNGQRRAELIELGRQRADRYDLSTMAEGVAQVYRSCASWI